MINYEVCNQTLDYIEVFVDGGLVLFIGLVLFF